MARLVTAADVALYNPAILLDGKYPMQVGDIIFFLTDKNVNGNIYNKTSWTSARIGASVWIEGGLDSYGSIEIGSSSLLTAPSDADNPNRIQFFNGAVNVIRTSTSLGGREVQLENFDYLEVDFESNSYPGLRDGWGAGRSGTFGLRVANGRKSQSAMALKIENSLGTFKGLAIRGCELTLGSFAKIRASFAVNELDYLIIERNLITRSVGGEGMYIGSTVASGPWPLNAGIKVRDNLIICTAAEAIQLGQVGDRSVIHNNVVFIAAHDYRDAFQASQDTLLQIDSVQGDIHVYDNIFWGFGSSGIHLFSKDASAYDVIFGTGTTKFTNNAILGGKKGHSVRVHLSYTLAENTIFRNNDIVNSARNYTDINDLSDYHYDLGFSGGATVPIKIIGGNIVNDGHPVLNGDDSSTSYFNVTRANLAEPEFVKSGFEYIDSTKISKWCPSYAVGHYYSSSDTSVDPSALTDGGSVTMTLKNASGSINGGAAFVAGNKVRVANSSAKLFHGTVTSYNTTTGDLGINTISNRIGSGATTDWNVAKRVAYTTDDFVWLAEDGLSLDMNLYKCTVAHDSEDETRPDLDPTKWELVYWDSSGRSMYDPAWDGTEYTTDFMTVAGDFRLVKGSYHHLLGRGLSCNEQRDDQSMYGWQWKDEYGTIRDIPGAYKITLTIADYSYLRTGRYFRAWVRKMNAGGVLESEKYSEWKSV